MIQTYIYDLLSGSGAIADIASTRIYPIELPQGSALPAVIYTINDITPIKSLDGESGLDSGSVEIVCWAKDYSTAHLLAAAVRAVLVDGGVGVMTDAIRDIIDEETKAFGVTLNITVWSESTINWSEIMGQTEFTGDGSTRVFSLPKYRAGSLLVFFNGRLARKGLSTDLDAAYWETSTRDGFTFRVAPRGGDDADKILAVYAKS